MNETLSTLKARIEAAARPAELFGPLAGDQTRALRQRYRELAAALHPDRHPEERATAQALFTALQRWHALARREVAAGTYGATPRIAVTARGRRYEGYGAPLQGDLCELFPADAGGEPLLLKVARHPHNGDLLEAEARALRQIERGLAGRPLRAHFPTLLDSFLLADAAGVRRRVNALQAEAGTLTLAAVLRARPQGLHPADAAWIFNRLLAALGSIHDLGLVHGAVHLEHVLIRPADHNALLIDWCYSVPIGASLLAISPPYAADYPPEAAARQPVTQATDIYMAARVMARLLGGTDDATLPPAVPPPLRALLRACLIPAPRRRPADAWQLFDEFQQLLRERYGPPAFRPFPVSA